MFSVLIVVCYLGLLQGVSSVVGALCGCWKPQVCTSSLQMHSTIHHIHIHTITPYKRDTWPTDQAIHYKKPTKTTHTRPPQHSTHLITNLDNTQHLILRTQIPQKLTKLLFTFLQHEIPQAATTVQYSRAPDDGHSGARNMLSKQ